MSKKGKKAKKNSSAAPAVQMFKAIQLDAYKNRSDNDWQLLDARNLGETLTREARATIRRRARFEIFNNSYAQGAALTICNSICPSVPRLQLTPREEWKDGALLNDLEDEFYNWALAVDLGEKVRAMRFAKFQDGESFAILHGDAEIEQETGVQLNFTPIDCSRVRSDLLEAYNDTSNQDGVFIDQWGRPFRYTVYNGTEYNSGLNDFTEYAADRVLHWFKKTTPEQYRGVSEVAPALLTLGYLRRYTYATVRAAEVAADLALILKTDDVDNGKGGDLVQEATFSRGSMAYFPSGIEAQQLKAEQPTAQFPALVDELLGAVGSSIGLPRLIIRKSAGGYTYASAKVDLSEMERFINIERYELKRVILSRLFKAWLKEYSLANNLKLPRLSADWYFEEGLGQKIDPLKEVNATARRFDYNITTLAREYAVQGLDWQKELEQKAKEQAFIKELEEKYNIKMVPIQGEEQKEEVEE